MAELDTKTPTQVSEEDDNARFHELKSKSERTEDETKEFGEIKERHGSRMQKKIDRMTWETKSEKEAREKAEQRADELQTRVAELETKVEKPKPVVRQETVKYEGKPWHTDEALTSMVAAGQMTNDEAYKHQRARERAEDRDILRKENEENKVKSASDTAQKKDAEEVLRKYPKFNQKHPNFDPNDKVYVLASQMLEEGLKYNPKGMSLAIKRAEQVLGIKTNNLDVTDDLSVHSPSAPGERRKREDSVALTEYEEEAALRIWRDTINPKTKRTYTKEEIKHKALKAKESRMRRPQ